MAAWLVEAHIEFGTLSTTTLQQIGPALTGGCFSLFISLILTVVLSFLFPQNFDWSEMKHIQLYNDVSKDVSSSFAVAHPYMLPLCVFPPLPSLTPTSPSPTPPPSPACSCCCCSCSSSSSCLHPPAFTLSVIELFCGSAAAIVCGSAAAIVHATPVGLQFDFIERGIRMVTFMRL